MSDYSFEIHIQRNQLKLDGFRSAVAVILQKHTGKPSKTHFNEISEQNFDSNVSDFKEPNPVFALIDQNLEKSRKPGYKPPTKATLVDTANFIDIEAKFSKTHDIHAMSMVKEIVKEITEEARKFDIKFSYDLWNVSPELDKIYHLSFGDKKLNNDVGSENFSLNNNYKTPSSIKAREKHLAELHAKEIEEAEKERTRNILAQEAAEEKARKNREGNFNDTDEDPLDADFEKPKKRKP